jgi:flagellar biosynthetic protein FlhB
VSDEQGEKSFDPTPRRREEFIKQGRFAQSKDIGGVVGMACVLGIIVGSREGIGGAVRVLFLRCHGDLSAIGRHDSDGIMHAVVGILFVLAMPAAFAGALGSIIASVAQSGIHVNFDAISFKPERLNPLPKLGTLFSPKKGTTQAGLSLLRVGLVGYATYRALIIELPTIFELSRVGIDVAGARLLDAVVRVILTALGALAGVAVVDYAQSRFFLGKEMMMTRKEVMDESRSQDGDPKVKMRMRARARALARKRSLNNVQQASVVVANPTHIAVALRYAASDPAPIVVAKGHDDVALQIRVEARKYGIPIIENRPLGRALDAEVPIGRPVPVAHFAAVARILAFVFRLRGVPRGLRKRAA